MKKVFSAVFFAVLFCFSLVPNSFAYTLDELPEIPTKDDRYYSTYYVYDTSNGPRLTILYDTESFEVSALAYPYITNNGEIRIDAEFGRKISMDFYLYDSTTNSWRLNQEGYKWESNSFWITDMIYYPVDIYDNEGELFFGQTPTELYQIIQKVTAESLTKESPILAGTMRTLTACGIGLLALLIGLILFGKVLRPYLNV